MDEDGGLKDQRASLERRIERSQQRELKYLGALKNAERQLIELKKTHSEVCEGFRQHIKLLEEDIQNLHHKILNPERLLK